MLKKILLASCMLWSLLCFGQGKNEQKITYHADQTTIGEVLQILVVQHKVKIAYDKSLPQLGKTKSQLSFTNVPVESVLTTILKGSGLGFKWLGGNYVIFENTQKTGALHDPEPLENEAYATLSGYVYDAANGETLIDATLLADNRAQGTNTNVYGYYALSLPKGLHSIEVSYLGYKTLTLEIDLKSDVIKNFRLDTEGTLIDEVVVTATHAKAKEAVKSTEMSRVNIPMEILSKTPALFGESDVIKAIQLIPGIKRGGEGGLGMYIRGGNNDENLILLDEATVYNPGHLLGFLSVFNSASLKSTDIYKGAFPSVYGGRLSGILDVRMREGNDQKLAVQGGIGNIASNLTIEGPIIKEKMSFIVSARRSYLDQLVNLVIPGGFPYYFYDFNAKINYKLDQRNRIYLSNYVGRDILNLGGGGSDSLGLDLGFGSDLGNTTTTLRWNHIYKNQKLFHNITAIFSQFRYKIEGYTFDSSIRIRSSIDDLGLKLDYDYAMGTGKQLKFGAQAIHHLFSPNLFVLQGEAVEVVPTQPNLKISNVETGIYASFDHEVSPSFRYNAGLRLSSSIATKASYFNLEPRASLRYALADEHSIKLGFARMNQYMHLVSGSTIALPTDLWYPSSSAVKPGQSDQVNAGYFTYLGSGNKTIQLSAETYYKWMRNLIEYREGARLILNNDYEKELVSGKGHAYGFEILAQKDKGHLTGWIGYTLSWSKRTFAEVNKGETYYARYDRRHDVAIVLNYFNSTKDRIGISAAWVYSSGSPFTPMVAKYIQPLPNYSGIELLPVYSARNAHRLNGSSRLDIDFFIMGKKRKNFQGEFHIGAYNVLSTVQPSRVTITVDPDTGKEKYQEKGLFGFIGAIAWKFKF